MLLSQDQSRLLRRSFVFNPALVNFFLNGFIAWLIYGRISTIPLPALTVDMLLTCFLIPFLTCLIVGPLVRQLVRQGDLSAVSWSRADYWWLRRLPRGKWTRALAVGLVTAVLGTLLIGGLLQLSAVEGMAGGTFVWFKAGYTAVLAAVVTPLLALAALADVSAAIAADPLAKGDALPLAQLPPDLNESSHRKAMQQDMISFIEQMATQGAMVRVPLIGPVNGYFLNDPDLIRAVLVTRADQFHKPAIVRFIELFYGRISSLPVPGWLPTATNRDLRRQLATIEAWLAPMVAERKAQKALADDVLSMLIEAQKIDTSGILTDHQVLTEVMNLFVAGYEVVAHTLAFTLYLVAGHPEVEACIVAELEAVLNGEPLTLETAGRLAYIDLVIKESMRLLPVTTVLTRQTAESVQLGGYTLPKNRLVLFAPWTLHRDSTYFPDPLSFKPERFDPDQGQVIPKYAYLPFGGGARICLGSAFALLQMKLNLATIWRHAHLDVAPGYAFEPAYAFNTRPKDGLPMVVSLRR